MAFKRREESGIEEERQALRAQHAAVEDLKRQLAERVAAVRERELELHHALVEADRGRGEPRAAAPPGRPAAEPDAGTDARSVGLRERELTGREQAAAAWEARLTERERELDRRERELAAAVAARGVHGEPAAAPDEARLAEIEDRLAELREGEKLFLRTRDELAARSEAVAAREWLVAQKERELDEREDASPWATAELSEVEARLRRLEQRQLPGEPAAGFADGLRKLQQGAKRPQRPV